MISSERLADTHCHLTLDAFDIDRDQVLARAEAEGISPILVPGIDLASSRSAVALADSRPDLFAAVGVHPHEAKSWSPATPGLLANLARHDSVVAIGEIGLDFYRDLSPRALQIEVFKAQLDLARRLSLPVVVHQRDAEDEVLSLLLEWHNSLADSHLRQRPGVLHGFSSSLAMAKRAMRAGFYVGLGGPVTFKNAKNLREMVPSLPLDRILTETDAPYLAPHPHRGKRNEPAMIRLVARALSTLMESPLDVVARVTSNNASSLFGWDNGTANRHLL
jgi:TatD DNase family protein